MNTHHNDTPTHSTPMRSADARAWRTVTVRDGLPKTATGKIQRFKLRQQAGVGSAAVAKAG